jgi:TonB family protein
MTPCQYRKTSVGGLVWIAVLACTLALPLCAQQPDKSLRKRVYAVEPVYPEILKQAYIGGTVKLHITITSNGTVERVSPLGGNPALVESAMHAVKKWKYVTATSSSEQDVSIDFDPRHSR